MSPSCRLLSLKRNKLTNTLKLNKLSAVLALSTFAIPITANAVVSSFTITDADATVQEVGLNDATNGWDNAGTAGSNTYDYIAINFTADTSGSYTFGQSSAPVDTVMAVYYDGAFDIDALVKSDVYNDDSNNPAYTCGISNLCPAVTGNLVAGQTNTLVISTYSASSSLSLPLGFYADGAGNISFVVYTPTTYSLDDAQPSLEEISTSMTSLNRNTSLLVNGAHSRPMSHRVAEGEKVFWVAGDWGEDNHGSRNGNSSLTEVNFGYNYGFAQLNFSVGKTWAEQDLDTSGSLDFDSNYLMVEAIIPVPQVKNLYATIGTHYSAGDAEISRGYEVSDVQNYSSGTTDTHAWGLRARLDWENLKMLSTTRISPYVDLNYTQITVDAYTETGGDQPAQFDETTENITEFRLGVNTATPISSSNFDFISTLEAVHRFSGEGENITGTVININSDFNIDGEDYKQNWFRAGLGVEGDLGEKGKLSLMLNGTTEGSASNAWLAASYQMKF